MKVDITFSGGPEHAASAAQSAEKHELDGFFVTETRHDPFLQLALAAQETERIELGTSVAIAFARNPMSVAATAYDLQRLSGGRIVLGLGSQIAAHITRRYSMPWSRPAARMEEFVSAVRAIWESWQTGNRLDFHGDFYTHTLMTPMFDPGPLPGESPKIWLAGVGPHMTEAAGRVADGLICHPFTTADYLRELTLPTVRLGRRVPAAIDSPFEISGMVMYATGHTEEEFAASLAATRERIAFYASTPAYRPVLDHHGWGALHEETRTLSKQGRWAEMGTLIDDEIVNAFAIVGELDTLGVRTRERFDGLLTRITVSFPYEHPDRVDLKVAEQVASS